ncbi:hypothetical protein DH09_16925 [Bacillaceae bacterium JMAK1]|nr:hypothetical protein DH09_16925 [Bacillaceae bacterium JMAK1]
MLVVPLLEYVYPSLVGESLTVQTITSAALVLTLFSTGAATVRHHFAKRIPYKKVIFYALFGSIGSFLSSMFLAEHVNQLVFLSLFLFIAIVSLTFNLIPFRKPNTDPNHRLSMIFGMGLMLFLGVVTGVIGVGGMILIIPYMVYVLHYSLKTTIAITTFTGVFISLFAIIARIPSGSMDWEFAILLGIGGLVGGLIAPSLSAKIPDAILKLSLNTLLFIIIMTVIVDLISII